MELMILVIISFTLDFLYGDFWGAYHPVVYIGRLIEFIKNIIMRITNSSQLNTLSAKFTSDKTTFEQKHYGIKYLEIVLGGVLAVITISVVTYITYLFSSLHVVFELLIINAAIAYKGLIDHLTQVVVPLKSGDIVEARRALGMIVGRDTENLSESEISRGGIETGAESISDGIIAPIFYGIIGGAPLMMAYKAINTLDSMVGYPFPPYKYIGLISAKLDDLVNLIPARLTAVFLLIAGKLLKFNTNQAFVCLQSEAKSHPSPNAGRPESTMAGLLNIRLGGQNSYQGEPSFRSYMNKDGNSPGTSDIENTIKLIKYTSWVGLIVLVILGFLLRWLLW